MRRNILYLITNSNFLNEIYFLSCKQLYFENPIPRFSIKPRFWDAIFLKHKVGGCPLNTATLLLQLIFYVLTKHTSRYPLWNVHTLDPINTTTLRNALSNINWFPLYINDSFIDMLHSYPIYYQYCHSLPEFIKI